MNYTTEHQIETSLQNVQDKNEEDAFIGLYECFFR